MRFGRDFLPRLGLRNQPLSSQSAPGSDLPLNGFVVELAADGRVLLARADEMDVLWLSFERIEVLGR